METLAPSISVVLVCDYSAGEEGGWEDFRKTLHGLAAQDFSEPVDYILCESEAFRDRMPEDFIRILPSLRFVYVAGSTSYDLKNAGVEAATCEMVAILDADCIPRPDWLRRLVESMRRHPDAAVVSGKTDYGGRGLGVRISALLSRAFVDPGRDGPTRRLSDNNAGYRRSVFLKHPLPTHLGEFATHAQSEEILRDGHKLWYESSAEVQHDFEGWSMEKDVRRHRGHAAVTTRLRDTSLPYSRLVRMGRIAIAPLLAGKILIGLWDCVRCARSFGLKWYQVPAAMTASVGLSFLEIPGMLAAYRGAEVGESCFR